MLEKINDPDALRRLSPKETEILADELRSKIIETTAKNGGHLASNLGMVEAAIALHRAFDTPRDKLFFDVSHQCYAHKLLTGRFGEFDTLRRTGGLSGFTNPDESEYDTVRSGHSGTAISTALAYAEAARLKGEDNFAVAIVGDGSLTNGMAYEAISNCSRPGLRLVILLNDNEMSISKSVGGIHHSLSHIRTSKRYFSFKHHLKKFFIKVPLVGSALIDATRALRDLIKRVVVKYNLFESLGLDYIGPVDGNNAARLEDALREAKTKGRCCVVHIVTVKGKGYAPAEEHPELYHSVPPFDPARGVSADALSRRDFSSEFGRALCRMATEDERICAISAAMTDGCGLGEFARRFPDRFFDTAITEEHAASFTAGLAGAGMKPVFAVYSTFSQRIYDQVFHDAALQRLPAVYALDRAGLVCGDGATHQGLYDYSMFSGIPGIEIYSPETYSELERVLARALDGESTAIVRYPRGAMCEYDRTGYIDEGELTYKTSGRDDAVIVTYGRLTANAHAAAELLRARGVSCGIIKLIKICPTGAERVLSLIEGSGARCVLFLEEGIRAGSVSEKLAAELALSGSAARRGFKASIRAVDDRFVGHGAQADVERELGFLPGQLADEAENLLK